MEFNELLAFGARYSRAIARLTSIAEQPGVTAVSPELFVMLSLEDTERFEWEWLKDVKVAAGRFDIAAVVGQQGLSELVVPSAAGQLVAIVRTILVGSPANTEISVRLISGAAQEAAISSGPFATDTRWDTQRPAVGVTEGTNAAPGGNTLLTIPLLANQPIALTPRIVIQRNNGASVVCGNTNTRILGAWIWDERNLAPQESNVT